MGRRGIATSVSVLCAVACAAVPPGASARRHNARYPDEPVAVGTGGAVASMDVGASRAGIDVLRRGGNAVDAAVATASALGVTVPFVAGPGGGGFMVIYNARTHRVTTIDGRETCPAACTSNLFVDPTTGKPMGYTAASDQPLSTGVPSMVATWATAVRDYGGLSLSADLQPAIRVGTRGFAVNFDFNQLEQSGLSTLRAYPASRSLLLTSSGDPLPIGTWLRNPDLAHAYELIARRGPSALYDGPIGRAIIQADDHPVLTPGQTIVTTPGILTMNDLRSYRTRILAPTQVTYRGVQLDGMAPPSSGGSTEGEILNILNGYPLGSESRVKALFQYLEASRLAYADRNAYVGDPDYVHVPLAGLLDPAFAATRRCLIGSTALTSPVAAGSPFAPFPGCSGTAASTQASSASPEAHHTNNIVTEDKWGDIVAYTNTINFFGGSGQVVPGYGFLLNNELTDFDFAPSSPGAYDPNLPAPGKEPRSSMGPVIALRDGQPQFAIGAAGGSTIITTVVQTLINHVDFGMSLPAALAAPRVSQTNSSSNTSLAEPNFYNSPLAQQLTSQYGEHFSLATGPILPLDNYRGMRRRCRCSTTAGPRRSPSRSVSAAGVRSRCNRVPSEGGRAGPAVWLVGGLRVPVGARLRSCAGGDARICDERVARRHQRESCFRARAGIRAAGCSNVGAHWSTDSSDKSVQRALADAEAALRQDPTEANQRRVMQAWSFVRRARATARQTESEPIEPSG